MELTVTNRPRAYPEGSGKERRNGCISICGFEGMCGKKDIPR